MQVSTHAIEHTCKQASKHESKYASKHASKHLEVRVRKQTTQRIEIILRVGESLGERGLSATGYIVYNQACKVSGKSKVVLPTKSMESGQQPFYFTGMFLLKLAGHVTKLSINSNWLLVFILLSVINFIGWRVYSCLVH